MSLESHNQSRREEYQDILEAWNRRFSKGALGNQEERVQRGFRERGWDAVFIDIYGLSDYQEVLEINQWGETPPKNPRVTSSPSSEQQATPQEIHAALDKVTEGVEALGEGYPHTAGDVDTDGMTPGQPVGLATKQAELHGAKPDEVRSLLLFLVIDLVLLALYLGVFSVVAIRPFNLGGPIATWLVVLLSGPLATALVGLTVDRRRRKNEKRRIKLQEEQGAQERKWARSLLFATPWPRYVLLCSIFAVSFWGLTAGLAINGVPTASLPLASVITIVSAIPAVVVNWLFLRRLGAYPGSSLVWIGLFVWIAMFVPITAGPISGVFQSSPSVQISMHPYRNRSLSMI